VIRVNMLSSRLEGFPVSLVEKPFMSESKDPSQISVLRPIRVGILSSSQTSFPQPNLEIEQSAFPQSSPKINFVPLFLETSCTLENRIEGALRWELVRLFDDFSGRKSEAILSYLASEESHEVDAWFRDDLRIAWLTVLHAASGMCDAWGYSFWSFFGKTYPRALKEWAERDRINRKALERCAEMVRASATYPTREPVSLMGIHATPKVCSGGDADTDSILDGRSESGETGDCTASGRLSLTDGTTPENLPGHSSLGLYESARAILALPPKKPVRNVKADKKREDAA